MDLINGTGLPAAYTLGIDKDAREHLVVVVKGTFSLPPKGRGGVLLRAEKQVDLAQADVYAGKPGESPVLYESDFAPRKPLCDVLVNGSAYAPNGKPAATTHVAIRLGEMKKWFEVHGERRWRASLLYGVKPSAPKPFLRAPIGYDQAFGGVDVDPRQPERRACYGLNPVGRGYHPFSDAKALQGKLLPATAELGKPIANRKGKYRPMSFGAVGRNFSSRTKLAGTYDERWQEERFPFLPSDFDPAYFQAAPPDQQTAHPRGGEEVVLLNLTPEGRTCFTLPKLEIPVELTEVSRHRSESLAVVDTIVIEPDLRRLTMCWRASFPLKNDIFDALQLVVGSMNRGWYLARDLGKKYWTSLDELARAEVASLNDAGDEDDEEEEGAEDGVPEGAPTGE